MKALSTIQAEFKRERDKLVGMSIEDPGILKQSCLVDLLHVELIKAEKALKNTNKTG